MVNILFLQPELWSNFQNALRQPIANALAVVDLLSSNNVGNLLGPLLAPIQVLGDVTTVVAEANVTKVAAAGTVTLDVAPRSRRPRRN